MTDSKEDNKNPEEIKKSLDTVVSQLDASKRSSKAWGDAMSRNKEAWEKLKSEIHAKQKALKELVREKKSGSIGDEEFQREYRILQDELTKLEFQVYNMRLGTDIKV